MIENRVPQMDLQAANIADAQAWRLARVSMLACFVIAALMLIASLAAAHSPSPARGSNATPHTLTP